MKEHVTEPEWRDGRDNRWAEEDEADWFLSQTLQTCGTWDSTQNQTYLTTPPTTKSTKTHPFLIPHTPSVLLPPLINLSLDRFLGVMGPFKLQGERGHRGVAGYLAGVVAFWRFTGSLQQSWTSCSLALKSHYAIDIQVANEDSGGKKGVTS